MHGFNSKRTTAAILVLVLALAAAVFRATNLPAGQVLLAILTPPTAWMLIGRQDPPSSFQIRSSDLTTIILHLLAIVFFGSATVLQLLQRHWIETMENLAGTVCTAWIIYRSVSGKERPLPCYLLLTVSVALKLIPGFRWWSVNPVIMEYSFRVFALLCFMLAVLHLSGLLLGEGNYRRAGIFCICGTVFCAMAAADSGMTDALGYLGYAAFLFGELWKLLCPGGRNRAKMADPNPKERTASDETFDWNHL